MPGRLPSASVREPMSAEPYQQLIRQIVDRWRNGDPPDTIEALRRHAELQHLAPAIAALASEEFQLRRARGERLDTVEFCARFPGCASQIFERIMFPRRDLNCTPSQIAELVESLRTESIRWPRVGERWEGVRMIEEIGRGAFARVYLAEEMREGNRPVIVKVSLKANSEAQIQGALFHPHIVPVLTAAHTDHHDFQSFIMPFLGRRTIEDWVAKRVNSQRTGTELAMSNAWVRDVLRIGLDVVEALRHMHARGVFHNDVKPANILLTASGRALLFDFNLATKSKSHDDLGGTLAYMAPERLAMVGLPRTMAAPLTTNTMAADLFSLAAVLYQLITGRLPYGEPPRELSDQEQAAWLVRRQLDGLTLRECPPVNAAGNSLLELLVPCLNCRVDQRFSDAAEFAERARSLFEQLNLGERVDNPRPDLPRISGAVASGVEIAGTGDRANGDMAAHGAVAASAAASTAASTAASADTPGDAPGAAPGDTADDTQGDAHTGHPRVKDVHVLPHDAVDHRVSPQGWVQPSEPRRAARAERRWWPLIRRPSVVVAVVIGAIVGSVLEETAWTMKSRPLTWEELSTRRPAWVERVGWWRTFWDPEDAEGWVLLGDGRLARFEPHGAGACYANALRLGLDTATLRNNLGLALCLQGRMEQAESAFVSALERDPEMYVARENWQNSRQTWLSGHVLLTSDAEEQTASP